jgi:molybdopterin-guanine dinucleotide biosynthesis protein MobB
MQPMKRLHIIGRKNHGKTTLIVELVQALSARSVKVGTIKHTHHRHELDVPGKDSYRHREAGAAIVGIVSQSLNAVFLPTPPLSSADRYAVIAPLFSDCDLVLVEGDSETTAPKIEVWRAQFEIPPLINQDSSIKALVTDDSILLSVPILPRNQIAKISDWIIEQYIKTNAMTLSSNIQ